MDSPPSSVRPNRNGKRIYHTISSVFSRKSSPVASSPDAPLSIEPPNFVPEAPILQPKSPTLSPQRKRQRIYNSISSAFSRMSSLRADSPEPIPDDSELDQGQAQIQKEEDEIEDQGFGLPRPMEVDREVEDVDCELTRVTDPAQPQPTSSGPEVVGRSFDNAKGTFTSAPTIAEVELAHKDLQRILKPRHHNR